MCTVSQASHRLRIEMVMISEAIIIHEAIRNHEIRFHEDGLFQEPLIVLVQHRNTEQETAMEDTTSTLGRSILMLQETILI